MTQVDNMSPLASSTRFQTKAVVWSWAAPYPFHFNLKRYIDSKFWWLVSSFLATKKKKKKKLWINATTRGSWVYSHEGTQKNISLMGPVVCKFFCGDIHRNEISPPALCLADMIMSQGCSKTDTQLRKSSNMCHSHPSQSLTCVKRYTESPGRGGYRHAAKVREASWNTVLNFYTHTQTQEM